MGFQDVMKQMFLRIAAGDVEPEEWEQWWNSNKLDLYTGGTAGTICIHRTGGFSGNHWKQ